MGFGELQKLCPNLQGIYCTHCGHKSVEEICPFECQYCNGGGLQGISRGVYSSQSSIVPQNLDDLMLQCKIVRGPYCSICTNPSINELCINECLECEYNKEYTNNLIKINEVNPAEEFEDLDEINGESSDYDKNNVQTNLNKLISQLYKIEMKGKRNKNEIKDVAAEEDENDENYYDLNLDEREIYDKENIGNERLHFNKKLFVK
uniref:Uncharacterized protein n=1 Tax=Meloidogyne enterolobii TaxID=390850 RepID=A0A6V7UQC1_MELEN|nr:unnamed protein product [Meloidogyne enterolobii]